MVAAPAQRTAIAHPLHTIVLVVAMSLWTLSGKMTAGQMRASASPHVIPLYVTSILFEWAVLAYIVWGVRRHGASLEAVLGPSWTSPRRFFKDLGIAAAFWLGSGILLVIFSRLLRADTAAQVQFMLPRTTVEIAVWILVAITAGICEEALFRGYLQRQFIAFTGSVPLGLILSSIIFGAGHAYQGVRSATLIGIYGLMFSLVAERRKSVRPGMIAHAWQDTLSGIALRFHK
jgi:hypothetical protein